MELEPGTMITGSVRLARPLAAGGMGTIWVAEHATLHTEVAVKIMMAEHAANEEFAARFSREAAASARVKSPHVVQVFDHGVTDGGLPFIVMELLEGHDLAKRLQAQRVLSPEQVADIVGQACKGLARAHAAGVVHRDIKPENLFLCEAEGSETFVKILDFGIAKSESGPLAERVTLPGAVFGTPHYMSPEQLVGAPVDHRTDLWALGIVAYEALTGVLPYETANIGALALAVHAPLPPPSTKRAELPASLDTWFAKACAAEPAERFSSAAELAAALREAVGAAVAIPEPASVDAPPTILRPMAATVLSSSNRVAPTTARGFPWALAAAVLLVSAGALVLWLRTSRTAPGTASLPASSARAATAPVAPDLPTLADSSPWAPVAAPASSSASSVVLRPAPIPRARHSSSGPSGAAASSPKRPASPSNYDDIR